MYPYIYIYITLYVCLNRHPAVKEPQARIVYGTSSIMCVNCTVMTRYELLGYGARCDIMRCRMTGYVVIWCLLVCHVVIVCYPNTYVCCYLV